MRKTLLEAIYSPDVRRILDRILISSLPPAGPEQDGEIRKLLESWNIDPDFTHAGHDAVDVALAQIALGHVEILLPDFTVLRHGRLFHARRPFETPHLSEDMLFKPIHLFTIDWALSAPGFSWPESYYATWLPGYDSFVVTLSQDSDEILGVSDLAIGWFSDRNVFEASCGRVVARYWKRMALEDGQEMWEGFVSEGRINEKTVRRWSRRVPWTKYF